MKKTLALLAAMAILAVPSYLLLGGGKVPESGYRLAVADRACPQEGEQGWAYINEHCQHFRTVRGSWCACITGDVDPLVGEVDVTELPDQVLRRFVVCETDTGKRLARFVKLSETVPDGWRCEVVINKALYLRSLRNVRTRLFEELEEKCCAGCVDECWIQSGSWGQCPYCLLDDNCDQFCPS